MALLLMRWTAPTRFVAALRDGRTIRELATEFSFTYRQAEWQARSAREREEVDEIHPALQFPSNC